MKKFILFFVELFGFLKRPALIEIPPTPVPQPEGRSTCMIIHETSLPLLITSHQAVNHA